ncbi:hypothetical protein, partial [Jeotgalibaca porci]|uniref:hypothetical protein n=1 Tax=Jeotgalibaca porci TaxID=1868793 RepID=UPI00359FDEFA
HAHSTKQDFRNSFRFSNVLAPHFEKSPKQFMAGKVFSIIVKMGFVIGFALYYVIVIARILQLIRG